MSTVSTAQTPDLLLSMLMGMLGSAPSTATAVDSASPDFLFTELLDSSPDSGLGQSELPAIFPETANEGASIGDLDSAAGQLNALIAASLGAMTTQAPVQTRQNAAAKTTDAVGLTAETIAPSINQAAKNTGAQFNENILVNSRNRQVGFESARTELNLTTAVQQELGAESIVGEPEMANLVQPQLEKNSANRIPANNEQPESDTRVEQAAGSARFSETAKTPQSIELATAPEVGFGLDGEINPGLGIAGSTTFQDDSQGGIAGRDNQESRPGKGRNAKNATRESDNSVIGGIAGGVFGGIDDNPMVTAVSGGTQSRQDGILGRGSADEQVAAAIVSREPSNHASQLMTPDAGQQLDLNAARADFEQSLDRVAENFPLESVAQQIVEVAEPDSGWISVEIQPPNLGKLEIMVSKQGEEYTAQIIAHEPSTQEALNLQQAELLEALNQHGLELKEVQIVSDSDSGNRWNLDSSRQDSQDGQSRGEFSGERREDGGREYPTHNQSNHTPKVMTPAAGTPQVNLLV